MPASDAAAGDERDGVEHAEERAQSDPAARAEQGRRLVLAARRVFAARYSHSIVPGGLLVMSSTTRLTSRISLIMREAICSSRS